MSALTLLGKGIALTMALGSWCAWFCILCPAHAADLSDPAIDGEWLALYLGIGVFIIAVAFVVKFLADREQHLRITPEEYRAHRDVSYRELSQ